MRTCDRRATIATLCALVAAGSPFRPAWAQQRQQRRPDPNPDASIEIEQVRVGVLAIGASVGGGRLRFGGEYYSFSVRGLEFGSLGIPSPSASGEAFNPRRLEDFPGRYEDRVAPRPPGREDRPETRFLCNQGGVELRVRTDRMGGQVRIAPAGVAIELRWALAAVPAESRRSDPGRVLHCQAALRLAVQLFRPYQHHPIPSAAPSSSTA